MITKPQRIKLANYLYGNTQDSTISPPILYAFLATGSVDDNGTITGEISGGGYARVPITNNKSTFSTATDDNEMVTNLIDIEFPESQTSWGNITVVGLSDSEVGGKALYYTNVEPSRLVNISTIVRFRGNPIKGDIQLTVS